MFAVGWAAFFNFVAAFGFSTAVAKTMGSGLIDISIVDPVVVLGGLIGAILWDIATWYGGIPTSSSHALMGGYGGAAVAKAGVSALILGGWVKPILFIVLSPVVGMVAGMGLMVATAWIFRRATPRAMDRGFRAMQLMSSAAFSLSHGTNDAQKTMGIIVPLLFSIGYAGVGTDPNNLMVPIWVVLSAHAAIALGTLAGGWRIVKTMGLRITRLRPVHGFAAETGGAATIIGASLVGIPVSTTHIITSSIMGVGATRRLSAVRWGVARNIVWAWILTIPLSAAIGFAAFSVVHIFM